MKQLLQKYADSIDGMRLRERSMFFGAFALVLMTLLQVFLLDPVLSRRNQLSAQIAQQEEETRAILARIHTLIRPEAEDRDALNRARLKSLRAQMEQLDRQFEQQQKQFVAPEKMALLLEELIAKNRNLKLMSLRNLPPTSLSDAAGGAQGRTAGPRAVFRHAVELKLSGSYFDLLNYVDALEHMPQQVFWEAFELRAAQYPQSVLTLTIYTLSQDRSWLTV